ncbi:hypothetical protein M0811_03107 [Anaeramoeba ignava]|uniref:Uncharacterized protein n=1 Tax=Anaeramoeba ignava TaxID=1746090 RepID=A0A9Q0R514_ANAIG|nr:hypothetical protein M0811_03107 [Anaeramoeba ignava]
MQIIIITIIIITLLFGEVLNQCFIYSDCTSCLENECSLWCEYTFGVGICIEGEGSCYGREVNYVEECHNETNCGSYDCYSCINADESERCNWCDWSSGFGLCFDSAQNANYYLCPYENVIDPNLQSFDCSYGCSSNSACSECQADTSCSWCDLDGIASCVAKESCVSPLSCLGCASISGCGNCLLENCFYFQNITPSWIDGEIAYNGICQSSTQNPPSGTILINNTEECQEFIDECSPEETCTGCLNTENCGWCLDSEESPIENGRCKHALEIINKEDICPYLRVSCFDGSFASFLSLSLFTFCFSLSVLFFF